jgi:diphthine-ammonia ligase
MDPKAKTSAKSKKGTVAVSWTGGKDGCFACCKAMLAGYEVAYLLNFRDTKKTGAHNLNHDLLSAQSEALGIPLLQFDFRSYEQEVKNAIRTLNDRGAGINGAVFGHIGTHRNLVDRICHDLDIELLLPLWNHDSESILKEFIDAGFEAIVISTNADFLGEEWLGRTIDAQFIRDLRDFNNGLDVCGENGEFHTFVIDGPLFKHRLRIITSEPIMRAGSWFLDISKLEVDAA